MLSLPADPPIEIGSDSQYFGTGLVGFSPAFVELGEEILAEFSPASCHARRQMPRLRKRRFEVALELLLHPKRSVEIHNAFLWKVLTIRSGPRSVSLVIDMCAWASGAILSLHSGQLLSAYAYPTFQ